MNNLKMSITTTRRYTMIMNGLEFGDRVNLNSFLFHLLFRISYSSCFPRKLVQNLALLLLCRKTTAPVGLKV